jgi:PAS domain S-box-containing protein
MIEVAISEAKVSCEKDILYQRWAAGHGGVYVTATDKTPPNPYLSQVPERDITTPSGRHLTLVNPEYMTHQVHELGKEAVGVRSHITSLKPINPQNAPDPWEAGALQAFEKGTKEVHSVATLDGKPYLRFMRPLIIEKGCLRCHEVQGYREGDIQGGLSVSQPIEDLVAGRNKNNLIMSLSLCLVWLVGVSGIGVAARTINKRITERKRSDEQILKQSAVLEAINRVLRETLTYKTDEEVARTCLAVAEELTNSKFGFIGEVNKEGRFDTIALSYPGWDACRMPDSDRIIMINDMGIRGIWGRVIKEEQSLIVNDPASHPSRVGTPKGHPPIACFLGVPLKQAGRTVGMIALANKEFGYALADQEAVEALSVSFVEALHRKRAERALYESEELLHSIMENANDAIFFVDKRGNIRFFNRKAGELYGYTPDEVLGKSHSVLVPKRFQEVHQKWMEKYLSLEESAISGKIVEGIGERKDGSEFYAETSTAILKQEGETFLVTIIRDITERKQAEEEKIKLQTLLSQAQKMEAIGHLTGGIAHDFNNILTAIIGYASLMQMKMKDDDPLRPNVNHILGSAERAANLTQSLLAFSRRQIINPQPVKINEIIYRTEKLLIRLLGEDIELKTILADEDPVIIADTGQVEQILMNLATNARDAMPSGGHLIIKTEMAEIDKQYIKTYGFGKIGHYVLLSVSDTGVGIDEKMLDKIFDPFFTTKEVGKGTGLGLSMAYGIVKQHDGYINCFSNLGKGTTFKIYFPFCRTEPSVDLSETQEAAPAPLGGTETILLAEDDADVRKLSRDILEKFGYTVIETVDGDDAIRAFRENEGKVHLLLLDVIMPKKNGKEAHEEIKRINPDIKALFLSGYTANVIHKRGILDKGFNFILKPVSPTELLRKVREVLNK